MSQRLLKALEALSLGIDREAEALDWEDVPTSVL